ncbi:MAG: alpha-D-ribose 1-methylphosphonate 5-phosphate C-P-lyase PhnJ, partial [Pseudomonadota bacterium]
MSDSAYNFAYLDEQTKRMIRRAILGTGTAWLYSMVVVIAPSVLP